jgi:glycosyltransferase involved in cell wall biosynthesis
MTDLAVIMAVYKNDKLKYLKESVQSILDQTFADFHYYIMLDGPVSADIDSYINSIGDNRIRLFRSQENKGLAASLNYLLEIVLSDPAYRLIARMDADDISLPERFEKQRSFLLRETGIACVGCWYEEIDENGKRLGNRKLPVSPEALKKRYYTRTPFAHPAVMYRRQLIETAGFYPTDTILMEDNVLWGRALKAGLRFANIPEYLLKFRIDRDFYKRRSGFEYGWKYLKTRIATNRSLHPTLSSYLFLTGLAVIKMSPFFINKAFYKLLRSHKTNP